jgi:hypothetical protein
MKRAMQSGPGCPRVRDAGRHKGDKNMETKNIMVRRL